MVTIDQNPGHIISFGVVGGQKIWVNAKEIVIMQIVENPSFYSYLVDLLHVFIHRRLRIEVLMTVLVVKIY